MLELLGQDIDLIVLARYMQILGPDFVAHYLLRISTFTILFCPRLWEQNPIIRRLTAA